MTPEQIIEAYDVLTNDVKDYSAQQAQAVGNSQRSIGGLAEVVANPSGQTSGLANYTYNRTMRPVVDSLAANLTTAGKSQALDRYLKDELMKAKSAYEDAKNNYTVASSASGGGGNSGDNGIDLGKSKQFSGREDNGDAPEGTTFEGVNVGMGEFSDLWTHEFNYSIPGTNIEVNLGGWDEEIKKGSDGNYYIWNKPSDTYKKITGESGQTDGGSRWWTK